MALYTNKRVIAGFSISITGLIILGFYSHRNIQQFIQARSAIFRTTQVLYYIEQAKSNSIKLEELVAWFILTQDSTLLIAYTDELAQATTHYTRLKKLTVDNESQQIQLDSLRSVGRKKLALHQTLMKAHNNKNPQIFIDEFQVNEETSKELRTIIDGLLAEENFLLKQRIAKSRMDMEAFQATFISLIVVALVVLVIVFFVVNRSLRAKTKAEEATQLVNKELEAFTYSVSHDLRAPLRSIVGFSQILKEDHQHALTNEGNRILEKVLRNARQMGQLIDDLLDFARTGRKELFISTIDVQLQVNEVIQEMEDNNLGWRSVFTVHPLSGIRGDATMMKQVWINLISNAFKYTRHVATPKIEIGNIKINGTTAFYIRDNGVGFDMQYYDKLFHVFQRLHSSTEFEGTGVGLALVHRIITRHRGKIWAESKPNEGTTFYFSLPT